MPIQNTTQMTNLELMRELTDKHLWENILPFQIIFIQKTINACV